MASSVDPHTNAYHHDDSFCNHHRHIDQHYVELAFGITLSNRLCYSVSHPKSPEHHAHGLAPAATIAHNHIDSDWLDVIVALTESIWHEVTFAHGFAECVTVTLDLTVSFSVDDTHVVANRLVQRVGIAF